LTLLEIFKYLFKTSESSAVATPTAGIPDLSVSDLLRAIEAMPGEIQTANGFYFLKGRHEIAGRRLENNFYAAERLKRAKKYLPGTSFVPFVSALAMAGSEAVSNSKQGSDIDLLVLTKPNRIWLGRLFLSAYFQLFGVRRHADFIENRFCLNHYLREGKVVDREKNLYTAIEYISLVPYFGGDKIYEFQKANLNWIKNYLAEPQLVKYPPAKPAVLKTIFESVLNNPLGDFLEKQAGRFQKHRIQIQDSVIVEDDELSFHPGNKGRQILEKFN